jgi:hypothetical protein
MGLSLTTLFFYPLISALTAQPFYMHWETVNTVEFVAALPATAPTLAALCF